MLVAQHISMNIQCDWTRAYVYAANPRNLPDWASGLSEGKISATKEPQMWLLTTPTGETCVRFSAENEVGVLDHWVSTPNGDDIYIPLRVIKNGTGCTFIFTLYRLPDMDEEQYARDAQWIAKDLQQLKKILES